MKLDLKHCTVIEIRHLKTRQDIPIAKMFVATKAVHSKNQTVLEPSCIIPIIIKHSHLYQISNLKAHDKVDVTIWLCTKSYTNTFNVKDYRLCIYLSFIKKV